MAEAIAALSLVSNILQLVGFGAHVVNRLNDFASSVHEVPKVFADIKIELPLVLNTLQKTKEQAELGRIQAETQKALLPVIDGCHKQVRLLDESIQKVLTTSDDSSWQRGRKALISIGLEKKIQTITDTLRGHIQILTYYQTAIMATTEPVPACKNGEETIFMVPFERDPKFIDRRDIRLKLEDKLEAGHRAALAGIGGVGKTQIAIEYCYRYHERDPKAHVFWVHASTAARVDQAYKQIARRLRLPGWDDLSLNTFEIVFDWLNEHGRWLLVFDNADDVDMFFAPMAAAGHNKQIHEYMPRCEDGTIIITTRDKRVAYRLVDREDPIMVLPMSADDASTLLQSKISVEQASADADLLQLLGNLPLAITQAAAFIAENNITITEYLDLLRTNQSEVEDLLSEELSDHRRSSDSGNSILNTLKISFDQIAKQKPLAADILSFMSFLDRNGIPKRLIKHDDVRSVDFISALGTLQAFSLITAEKGGGSFGMHRLVQISTQRWLRSTKGHWQGEVLRVLSETFPLGDFENWKDCETLSPHAQLAISYSDATEVNELRRAKILDHFARYDGEQSRYEVAEKRYLDVIAARKRLLGVGHPETLQSMSYLGEVLFREGKYVEAESLLRTVIAESDKLFGPQSEQVLYNTGLLAEVLQGAGQWAEAETLYRTALEGEGVSLPAAQALRIADCLGAVLRDEKKYDEAEMWIRKGLVGREQLLGPTHLDTLRSVNHLALLLSMMGRLEEAELLARRAIAGSEMSTGRDHHLTFMSIHTLGKVLILEGEYESAAEQCRRALDGFIKVLGPDNRGTLRCLQSLALIEEAQGHYAEAEALLVRVVDGNTKVLGGEHQHTLNSIKDVERVRGEKELQGKTLDAVAAKLDIQNGDHPLIPNSNST